MSRQFATNVTTIYDIFCPVPFLPSPFGFRRVMLILKKRSLEKITPTFFKTPSRKAKTLVMGQCRVSRRLKLGTPKGRGGNPQKWIRSSKAERGPELEAPPRIRPPKKHPKIGTLEKQEELKKAAKDLSWEEILDTPLISLPSVPPSRHT